MRAPSGDAVARAEVPYSRFGRVYYGSAICGMLAVQQKRQGDDRAARRSSRSSVLGMPTGRSRPVKASHGSSAGAEQVLVGWLRHSSAAQRSAAQGRAAQRSAGPRRACQITQSSDRSAEATQIGDETTCRRGAAGDGRSAQSAARAAAAPQRPAARRPTRLSSAQRRCQCQSESQCQRQCPPPIASLRRLASSA